MVGLTVNLTWPKGVIRHDPSKDLMYFCIRDSFLVLLPLL